MPDPITVRVRIDAERASQEFKRARKDIQLRLKAGYVRVGQRIVLPRARANAPGSIASTMTVKATLKGGFLTTTLPGKKAAKVGLLEFGGTRRDVLRPKKAKALLVNGTPVARVDTPRVYAAQQFMTKAVEGQAELIEFQLTREIMQVFDWFQHTP